MNNRRALIALKCLIFMVALGMFIDLRNKQVSVHEQVFELVHTKENIHIRASLELVGGWLVALLWHFLYRLTWYSGLSPTSNKLSSLLHFSGGSLVSSVWQAACLQVRFQPRQGRVISRGKLSSFCQTTGKRRSFFLFLSLFLSLTDSIYLSVSVSPFPWWRSSLSQCLLCSSVMPGCSE